MTDRATSAVPAAARTPADVCYRLRDAPRAVFETPAVHLLSARSPPLKPMASRPIRARPRPCALPANPHDLTERYKRGRSPSRADTTRCGRIAAHLDRERHESLVAREDRRHALPVPVRR